MKLFKIILTFLLIGSYSLSFASSKLKVIVSQGSNFLVKNLEKIQLENSSEFDDLDISEWKIEVDQKLIFYFQKHYFSFESKQTIELSSLLKNESGVSDLLSFIQSSITPQVSIIESIPRGNKNIKIDFEKRWNRFVLSSNDNKKQFSLIFYLSLTSYFERQKNYARVAYLSDFLSQSFAGLPHIKQYRSSTLARSSYSEIEDEINGTKVELKGSIPFIKKKVLLIGIQDYENPSWQKLNSPIKDIHEIKKILIQKYFYQETDIILLENATYQDIISNFIQLKKVIDPDTSLLVYYAGHGFYPQGEEEGYWIPKDAGAPESQRAFISSSSILGKIKALNSKHTLLIADACFSGSLLQKYRGVSNYDGYYMDLSKRKSRQIITSGGIEPVLDSGDGKHSIFAKQFIDILRNNSKATISASELALNLRKNIKNIGAKQTPEYGRLKTSDDENGEFFFVQAIPKAKPENKIQETGNSSMMYESFRAGFFFHLVKLFYTDSTNSKINFTIEGAGTRINKRIIKKNFEFGYDLSFGQLTQISSCSNEDEDQDEDHCGKSSTEIATTVNGQFYHFGTFLDFDVYEGESFSIQLGSEARLQHYVFTDFLEKGRSDSTSIAFCANTSLPFIVDVFSFRTFLNLCMTSYVIRGSLHEINNDEVKNVVMQENVKTGFEFSFDF